MVYIIYVCAALYTKGVDKGGRGASAPPILTAKIKNRRKTFIAHAIFLYVMVLALPVEKSCLHPCIHMTLEIMMCFQIVFHSIQSAYYLPTQQTLIQ